MNVKKIDISVGACLSVLSVAIYLYAETYKGSGVSNYGPNVFPQFLAVMLFITSIMLIVNAVKGKSQTDLEGINLKGFIRTSITVGISIVYLIVMQFIGFFVATLIFLYSMITYLGQKSLLTRIISSVAVSIIVYFIFKDFLKIPLPSGYLGLF
jgi:putative tricarboxylic transport membrane protein